MNRRTQLLVLVLITAAAALGVGALFHFGLLRWQQAQQLSAGAAIADTLTNYSWAEAVEKVKEVRMDAGGAIETPAELKHYSDRHWFLATQVAEVEKYQVPTCQDFVDLAGMIERGEMVTVPAVTRTYVLYGVGEKADDDAFSRSQDGQNVDLYNETELHDAYARLGEKRSNLQREIAALKKQSRALNKRERGKQSELQKQITARQEELNSTNEDKALLDKSYGQPSSRQKLLRDYESLQRLAKNLAGRSFNFDQPSERLAMKVIMLSSLRPEAKAILEQVAAAYQRQFDRPLPVSSLVRPEQYQHALNRVNRNAVLIDTPPHSTGLAFDIDYRYMSAAEQTFLMGELARLEIAGRIEVIRERNANYHVFAFLNGTRPSDELITASLDEATVTEKEAHHSAKKPAKAAKVEGKPRKERQSRSKTRTRR